MICYHLIIVIHDKFCLQKQNLSVFLLLCCLVLKNQSKNLKKEMINMKKLSVLLSILMVLSIILTMVGCSSENPVDDTTSSTETSTEENVNLPEALSNIINALLPFKYPIKLDTLVLGGMLNKRCTWSGIICPSIISTPLYFHNVLIISCKSFLYW